MKTLEKIEDLLKITNAVSKSQEFSISIRKAALDANIGLLQLQIAIEKEALTRVLGVSPI